MMATVTMGLECAEGALDRMNGPNVSTRSLAGTWEGPIVTLVMRFSLTDNNGTINGTGTMLENGTTFTLGVTGTRNGSAFSLNITEVGHETFTYTGTISGSGSGTTLTGLANGSGFVDQGITMTKQ